MEQILSPKKKAMEQRILDAIYLLIEEKGLEKMGARDVAEKANCSVGSIYSVFNDLDGAIFKANAQTLKEMDLDLEQVSKMNHSEGEGLKELAKSYTRFALKNKSKWRAVFFHHPQPGVQTPQWYLDLHSKLIHRIIKPLQILRPDLTQEQASIRARTLFAATHGVIQLAMENRFVGVPQNILIQEVEALVNAMTRGLGHSQ
jgi:AcrR family transcriptional regulator